MKRTKVNPKLPLAVTEDDDIAYEFRYSSLEKEPLLLVRETLEVIKSFGKDYEGILSLFIFYYDKVKRFGNPIKMTNFYVAKGMGWGVSKVKYHKKFLKDLGLVNPVIKKNEYGQIISHLIDVEITVKPQFFHQKPIERPLVTLSNPNSSTRSRYGDLWDLNNKKEKNIKKEKVPPKEKNIIPPSIELVKQYCHQRKNGINAQSFIDFYEAKGWMIGKNKMKDWQAAVRTWEQNHRTNGSKSSKPKFIYDDGIKYVLGDDGRYRHSVTGDIYIP